MTAFHGVDKNGLPAVLDTAADGAGAQKARPNLWIFPFSGSGPKVFVDETLDYLRKQLKDFSGSAMSGFFGAIPVRGVYDYFYRTSSFHSGGWEFFASLPSGAAVLVVEAGLGTASLSIARLASQVWSLFENKDFALAASLRAEQEKASNMTVVSSGFSGRLPFHDAAFDAVSLRGWGDDLRPSASFSSLVSELKRLLKPGGTFYVDGRGFFPLVLVIRLLMAGFQLPRLLIHLEDGEKLPYELRFGLRHGRLRAMLKNVAYLFQRSRHSGLLARKPGIQPQPSMIDQILSEIPGESAKSKANPFPLHYGSFDIYGLLTDTHVIRMPTTEVGERRCETGMRAMQTLKEFSFSFEMPTFIKFGRFRGQSFYAESRISGKPAAYHDFSMEDIQRVRKSAQACLADLYGKTRKTVTLGNEELSRLFFEPISAMIAQSTPAAQAALLAVKKTIENRLKGKVIDLVHTHGDFKASNFLLNEQGGISGIIDWDMAKPDGLPLTDVVYCEGFQVSVKERMVLPHALFEAAFKRRDEIKRNLSPELADYAANGAGYELAALMMLIEYYLKHPSPELRMNQQWKSWSSDCLVKACAIITADDQGAVS